MDARTLKTLLRTLQEFGVSSYHDGDVTVQFGAGSGPVPPGDIEGELGDLALPPGTPDPRAAIRQVYARAKARAS